MPTTEPSLTLIESKVPAEGPRVPPLAEPVGERPASLEADRVEPLFRPEVISEQRAQWLGTVLLAPRLSHRVFTLVGVLAAAAVLALLFFGSFTRTAHVVGWLQPEEGVARVLAPRTGVVASLHVAEGASVRKGDRLVTLSDELQSSTLGATQAEIGRQLVQRRDSLLAEHAQMQRLLTQQQAALSARAAALGAEQAQIEREIELLGARLAIAERNVALHRKQQAAGYISGMRLQMVEAERLEQAARLSELERNRLTIKREAMGVQAELKDLPLKADKELAAIERSLAQIGQERAESEARREIVLAAPHDGTVTAIQAVVGTAASPNVPLLSIVPAGARLEAHLYAPSRAIGFLRPGQRVRLRYQAYPYQRFGHHEGVVINVARSAVSPAELPAQLTGVARPMGSAAGGAAPVEPLYRIVASIASQSMMAYGSAIALQPGMAIEADVALDRRRLYEWVLDPIYAVTGKWQ